jgi:hypothetical protein
MKQLLTAILFLAAFSVKAQLNNVSKLPKKDTTLSSKYYIPVVDSVSKVVYKITPKSLQKSIEVVDTLTGTPDTIKVPRSTFRAYRNPVTDSVFFWFNINGVLRKK